MRWSDRKKPFSDRPKDPARSFRRRIRSASGWLTSGSKGSLLPDFLSDRMSCVRRYKTLFCCGVSKLGCWIVFAGNTKGGSIAVPLTSCLTGLESVVLQQTFFCLYLRNRLIQTSQTGAQWYIDTSPFTIPLIKSPVLTPTKLTNQEIAWSL